MRHGGGLTGPDSVQAVRGGTGLGVHARPPQQAPVLLQIAVKVCAVSFAGQFDHHTRKVCTFSTWSRFAASPLCCVPCRGVSSTRPKTSLSQTGIIEGIR